MTSIPKSLDSSFPAATFSPPTTSIASIAYPSSSLPTPASQGCCPRVPTSALPQLPAAFAEAFFKKGVANYICTAWPVGDDAALQFAVELYTYLLGDGTAPLEIYQAMRQARRKIVGGTNTWGAYQHYGNPNFRLLRV